MPKLHTLSAMAILCGFSWHAAAQTSYETSSSPPPTIVVPPAPPLPEVREGNMNNEALNKRVHSPLLSFSNGRAKPIDVESRAILNPVMTIENYRY